MMNRIERDDPWEEEKQRRWEEELTRFWAAKDNQKRRRANWGSAFIWFCVSIFLLLVWVVWK